MNRRKQTKDLNFQLQMMGFLVGVVLLSITEMVCKGTKLIGISADPQYMDCEQQYVGWICSPEHQSPTTISNSDKMLWLCLRHENDIHFLKV